MNQNPYQIVAVDLAKDSLEVLWTKGNLSLSNNDLGFAKLKEHLRDLSSPLIVVEATGGYERPLVEFLHAHKIAVAVVNPRRIRAFAISEGINAKTDVIDTKMIMRFAQSKSLRITLPPDPARQQLADLMDRRNQLSETLTREKNRLQKAPPCIRPYIEKMISTIEAQIAEIDEAAARLVEAEKELSEEHTVITSVKGVGNITAWHIIAMLPEIKHINRNQLTCLVGLAPFNRDSGNTTGKRYIRGGRHKLRKCLYMATVAAMRCNDVIGPYVKGLKDRGKPHNCAVVAGMRKLIIHIQNQLKNPQLVLAS